MCDTYMRACACACVCVRKRIHTLETRSKRGRGRQKEKPINFTMANSETVATPFLQFSEVIKV